jgi:signal transduction histidine kinase
MKQVYYIVGILSLIYLGKFASDTFQGRGYVYGDIGSHWTIQLDDKNLSDRTLPTPLEKINGPKPGAKAILQREIIIPPECQNSPCFIFFGEVGDLAKIYLNNHLIKTQGYSRDSKSLARHFPLWVEIPTDIQGRVNLKIEIESLYGYNFGVQRGPLFIGDYAAVRSAERHLSLQTVTFPLMQALVLLILGLLAISTYRLAKLEMPLLIFGIFCITESAFMLSFSFLPREYLSATDASWLHFTLRLLADWALFECLNSLIPMRKYVPYVMRGLFLFYLAWLGVLALERAPYPDFVHAVRCAFIVIVGTPLAGFVTSICYWRSVKLLASHRHYDLPILIPTLGGLLVLQSWDTTIFWGKFTGPYLVKFYLVPLAFLFTIIFVKRQIRAREELLREKSKADQDALLGQLAVEFSHDLKGPLNTLKMAAEVALEQNDVELMKRTLGDIAHRTKTVTTRVQQLLNYAKTRITQRTVASLKELEKEIRSEVEERCQAKKLTLELVFQNKSFLMDREAIKSATINLIDNAVEASFPEGKIVVWVQVISQRLIIRVQDYGHGIEESKLSRIFEPYFTQGKTDGTGLGLAIVDRITRLHGGSVEVVSKPMNGSTFIMEIPQ